MIRITINKLFVLAAAIALTCAGCGKEYDQSRLDSDSPEAKRVESLVAQLRKAGPDGLDATLPSQAKEGLTIKELKGLRSALERIVSADEVSLRKIERFGGQVYRAVLTVKTPDGDGSLAMLLTTGDDGKLRWIGSN